MCRLSAIRAPAIRRYGLSAALCALRMRRTVQRGVSEPLDAEAERDIQGDVHESQQGAGEGRTDKQAQARAMSTGRATMAATRGRSCCHGIMPRPEAYQDQTWSHLQQPLTWGAQLWALLGAGLAGRLLRISIRRIETLQAVHVTPVHHVSQRRPK